MRALRHWREALAAIAVALVVPAAFAHTKSETHSVWEIAADRVVGDDEGDDDACCAGDDQPDDVFPGLSRFSVVSHREHVEARAPARRRAPA